MKSGRSMATRCSSSHNEGWDRYRGPLSTGEEQVMEEAQVHVSLVNCWPKVFLVSLLVLMTQTHYLLF